MLQLEPGMMIWTWVTFFFLFLILARVAWKPLLSAVDQREKTISESLQKAEAAKSEAQQLLEEQDKKLSEAQDEIQKMMKQNKEMAEKTRNEMIENAKDQVQKLHQRAQADIARETEAAVLELKKQVADLAIQAASRLIQEKIDAEKHRSLIDQYIRELENFDKN
jgi:F-type H+-transporting ATPase subunit b